MFLIFCSNIINALIFFGEKFNIQNHAFSKKKNHFFYLLKQYNVSGSIGIICKIAYTDNKTITEQYMLRIIAYN